MAFLINQKFPTFEADAAHNLHEKLEELGVIYGPGELKMPKMAGAMVIGLSARTTYFTVLQYTHAWIKETAELPVCRRRIRNLTDRSSQNLFGTENPELNPDDRFGFGGMGEYRHISSVL